MYTRNNYRAGIRHVHKGKWYDVAAPRTIKQEEVMKALYISIALFVMYGCKTRVRNECVAKDSIVVTYYRGHYESFSEVSFVDMKHMSDRKMPNETIRLDSTLFRKFKSFIKRVSRDSLSADDARFYLKCHKDEMTMGIPVHLQASQEQTDKSLRYTIYQILWKTKYFNTIKHGSLKYVLLIKEFGVPDDYRYDETSSCSDKVPSKLKKIILVERNK